MGTQNELASNTKPSIEAASRSSLVVMQHLPQEEEEEVVDMK